MKQGMQTMKRVLSFIMAFAMVLTLLPATVFAADNTMTIYLKAGTWDQANAWFDAWVWGSAQADAWYTFADTDGDLVYEVEIPADATGMKIHRKNPATTDHNHNDSWNDSGDLTINSSNNCYEITDWSAGRWVTYDPATASVTFTVAGEAGLCGTAWATNNTANDMAKNAAGLYEKVYTNVAAGTYKFKVAANHSWDKSWGDATTTDGNAVVTVAEAGSTVTITFDAVDKEIGVKVEAPVDIPAFTEVIKVVAIGCKSHVTYIQSSSSKCEVGEPYEENGEYLCDITVDLTGAEEEYQKFFDEHHEGYTHSNPQPAIPNEIITVTAWWDGEKWTAATNYYPDHYYNFTCTEIPDTDPLSTGVYLVGDFNNWNSTSDEFKKADESATSATLTLTLEANRTYEFKIVNNGTEYSTETNIGGDLSGIVFLSTITENAEMVTYEAGEYVFTYDVGGNLLAISYPEAAVNPSSYNVNFVTGTDATIDSQNPLHGETVTRPTDDPTREGYTFGGWYTDEACENAYDFSTPVTSDLTLYAKWDPDEGSDEGGETAEDVTYEATFHFINTLNWNVVNLYTWIGNGTALTGQWPGSATTVVGSYNTATVTFEAAEGTPLNFIFNNGSTQTVDLTLPVSAFTKNDEGVYVAEKYVALTSQTGGKYNAAIVDSPAAIVNSPIVDGSSVTFNYGGSAQSVAVAGTFNDWTPAAMTSEDGVWTLTVDNLAAGDYQYKFVVDDTWILDPMNSNVVTEADGNQNNAFYILSDETVEDDNKVTIKVHYTRADGNYENWNLWVWGSNLGGYQEDFDSTDENGAVVATIELKNAREHQNISFKERKSIEGNEWADQGEKDRSIDLSTIVSGTIDYYIPSGSCDYGEDVIRKNKISSVELDYDNGVINVTSVQAIPNAENVLKLIVGEEEIDVTITAVGSKYSLALPEGTELNLAELYKYQVDYYGDRYSINIAAAYASDKFAQEFTYEGDDLGATYSAASTTFKVWAPTATGVSVKLYATGSDAESNAADLDTYAMTKGEKGVWTAEIEGDLKNLYYTYAVDVDGETVEAVDPYARTTGVNGERGMIIDLGSTNPAGWANDTNPNPVTSQTDAVIYELHVRDFSIDASSGVSAANRGKYLAFTEKGTTVNGAGVTSTGIDYLKSLGITHLHLLPVYDYGSVDETKCENFNWGYDPVNYNVPEGSYSTNPYDGATRVNEFKQMVKSLHDNGISVVMDVVYNHVYNADKFCFNNIVPGYFSRVSSNASGCGNDTASEREMVRKYIVESVLYWTEEYHIDGFRFDLVGLLDVQTINEIVTEVHKIRPDVIFYGEGWDMDGTNKEPGTQMAKQGNAYLTPGFAYFSDSFRNGVGGSNDGKSTGFASGAGNGAAMATEWMAKPSWTSNPQQVVQYVSCHDNYTLADKIILSTGKSGVDATVIKMNNLAAAFYMTAQGVPFIHAGEELLREKVNPDGSRNHNSYNSSDEVNKIVWTDLEKYADNSDYYQGLIAFRKAHPALRYATAAEVKANVQTRTAADNVVAMQVDGYGAGDDDIFVIFNAAKGAQTVNLPEGEWTININGEDAGTASLGTATGTVSVAGISAMVLTKEDEGKDEAAPVGPSEEKTVYFSNNKYWSQVYAYAWTGDTHHLGDWPGVAMTFVEKNSYGEDIYSVTLPASEDGIEGLIFHNNSGAQTVDIVPGIDGTGYYCTDPDAEGHFEVGTYSYRAPVVGGADEYYLHGWINNADYTGTDYKFGEDGTVTATFSADSYVYVTNGDGSETYMTDGYQGAVTSATLKDINKCTMTADKWDKLLIPGGDEVVITMVKNDDNTITLSYESSASAFEDKSGVQKGVTLHCWNWSFNEIKANMATIAAQGYTAIQTSPIQVMKEATNGAENTVGSHWWVYYQPVDFVITTDSGNALGTKDEFQAMCAEAEKYGIKVIVDVVANHLGNKTGNDLADAIPQYLREDEYWHDITQNITSWDDRENMTQRCLSGLPDLNTANKEVQGFVLKFLKECVDAGADGFRFDMAKSIETPKDDASFASDFWPTVVGGIQEYAGGDLYIYGEVLDDAKIAISAYTEYMSVTDNGWGNHMRMQVAEGTANLVSGFYKSAPASNLVIWAESHDTYMTGDEAQTSYGVSEADINKTWALVAARADAMGLYLARPESLDQALGVASRTGWANKEVKAANKFHNAFAGQSETVGNSGNISYVVRGSEGIVMVNVSGTTANVELTVPMANGTYTDQISGNTFTVANGKLTGTIGDTGIAVVYGEELIEELFDITSSSMVLGNELAMYFYVPNADLEGEDYVAVVTKSYADGRADVVVEIPFSDWEDTTNDRKRFKFDGIAAKEMSDNINVVIKIASTDEIASNPYNDSVRGYVGRAFTNGNIGETNGELATMLIDMLNYGAAAQEMFGYNVEHPANEGMEAYQSHATQSITLTNEQEKGTGYRSMSAVLESNISLIMFFEKAHVTTDMTAVVTFTDHYGHAHEIKINGADFEDRGAKGWGIVVDELVVADGCQLVTCKFLDANGNEVEGVYGIDSLESMCARAVAGGGGDWYEYIMKFSASAYNYFH